MLLLPYQGYIFWLPAPMHHVLCLFVCIITVTFVATSLPVSSEHPPINGPANAPFVSQISRRLTFAWCLMHGPPYQEVLGLFVPEISLPSFYHTSILEMLVHPLRLRHLTLLWVF